MQTLAEKEAPGTEPHSFGTPWIKITFTLEARRYNLLRGLASDARLTVPSFVCDIIEEVLRKAACETSNALGLNERSVL